VALSPLGKGRFGFSKLFVLCFTFSFIQTHRKL